jgi:hypothetical protein
MSPSLDLVNSIFVVNTPYGLQRLLMDFEPKSINKIGMIV